MRKILFYTLFFCYITNIKASNPGYLGISIHNYENASLVGVLVVNVFDESAAKQYGLKENGGLGLTLWFSEMVGLSFQSTYKYSLEDSADRGMADNIPTHMQHFAGLTFKFGGKDIAQRHLKFDSFLLPMRFPTL